MSNHYFEQPAELHVKISRTYTPDAPLMKDGGKVAAGSLNDMIDQWGALSASDRLHHIVLVGGGALNGSTLKAMFERSRTSGE